MCCGERWNWRHVSRKERTDNKSLCSYLRPWCYLALADAKGHVWVWGPTANKFWCLRPTLPERIMQMSVLGCHLKSCWYLVPCWSCPTFAGYRRVGTAPCQPPHLGELPFLNIEYSNSACLEFWLSNLLYSVPSPWEMPSLCLCSSDSKPKGLSKVIRAL